MHSSWPGHGSDERTVRMLMYSRAADIQTGRDEGAELVEGGQLLQPGTPGFLHILFERRGRL